MKPWAVAPAPIPSSLAPAPLPSSAARETRNSSAPTGNPPCLPEAETPPFSPAADPCSWSARTGRQIPSFCNPDWQRFSAAPEWIFTTSSTARPAAKPPLPASIPARMPSISSATRRTPRSSSAVPAILPWCSATAPPSPSSEPAQAKSPPASTTPKPAAARNQKATLLPPFNAKNLTRFVRRCHFQPKPFDNLARFFHLLRIALGKLTRTNPQTIFQPHAHVRAHCGGHRRNRQLVAPRAEHRPAVLIAEQAVRRSFHMHHIFRMRADAAQNAEHGLHEQRRLHQTALQEMRKIVKMPHIVAFKLKAGAGIAQLLERVFDIGKRVAENQVSRTFQMLPLPLKFEFLKPIEHREEAEIHRAHIERGNFRLKAHGRSNALADQHMRCAARGQVHHRIRRLFDARQKCRKGFGALVRLAGFRVPRVQMNNGRARLGSAHRCIGNLLRRHRQIG